MFWKWKILSLIGLIQIIEHNQKSNSNFSKRDCVTRKQKQRFKNENTKLTSCSPAVKITSSNSYAIAFKNSSAFGLILKTISSARFSNSSLVGYLEFSSINLWANSLKYSCCWARVENTFLYWTCEWISVSSRSSTNVYFLVEAGSSVPSSQGGPSSSSSTSSTLIESLTSLRTFWSSLSTWETVRSALLCWCSVDCSLIEKPKF